MTRSNISQKFIQQPGEIIKNTEKLLHSYTVIRCVSIRKKQAFQAIKLNPLARISRIQLCTGEAYQKNFTKSSTSLAHIWVYTCIKLQDTVKVFLHMRISNLGAAR